MSLRLTVVASAATLAILAAGGAFAAAADYRIEIAAPPAPATDGKAVLSIRIMHIPDGKPAADAVIFRTRADMAPAGMATMTAPVQPLGEAAPGVYRFAVRPGMAGKWAFTLSAKAQGETDTVNATLVVDLAP
jgi:hypothetical protein